MVCPAIRCLLLALLPVVRSQEREAVGSLGGLGGKADPVVRARKSIFLGNFSKAASLFDEAVEEDPSLGSKLWDMGIALYYTGRFIDAAAQFARVHDAAPSAWTLVWHDQVRRMYPKHVAALADLERGPEPETVEGLAVALFRGPVAERAGVVDRLTAVAGAVDPTEGSDLVAALAASFNESHESFNASQGAVEILEEEISAMQRDPSTDRLVAMGFSEDAARRVARVRGQARHACFAHFYLALHFDGVDAPRSRWHALQATRSQHTRRQRLVATGFDHDQAGAVFAAFSHARARRAEWAWRCPCEDDPDFVDPAGFPCFSNKGHDCLHNADTAFPAFQPAYREVVDKCPRSCGLCVHADEPGCPADAPTAEEEVRRRSATTWLDDATLQAASAAAGRTEL